MECDTMERVHFYSAEDLSMGSYLDRLESVLDAYVSGGMMKDINDVMELWHCKQFVESWHFRRWDAERYSRYQGIVRDCVGDIVLFFKMLDEDAFLRAFYTLDFDYRRTVFEVFDSVARDFLTASILRKILSQEPHLIREVLHGKNTVRKWAVPITEFLKAYPSTAELLLEQFGEMHEQNVKEMVFPERFSLPDREACISDYCDWEQANLHYVRLAVFCKDCNGLKLGPKTRLKAKKTAEKLNAELYEEGDDASFYMKIGCTLEGEDYKYDRPIVTEYKSEGDDLCLITHVQRDYLLTCDSMQIVYNFRWFFEWFNRQGYSTLVSNPNYLSVFECMGGGVQHAYLTGSTFMNYNRLAVIQLMVNQNALKEKGKSLEAVIKDFYENHLKNRYGYPSPRITISADDADYVTKLRTLMPEMDAVVKHYDTFVENGSIDLELIALSKPLSVTAGRSLLKLRNVYVTSDKSCAIHGLCRLLFSDQSPLANVKCHEGKTYDSLFDAMRCERLDYDSLYDRQKHAVDFLVEHDILMLDAKGTLRFLDMNRLTVYFYLWKYQVVSYWQCTKDMREEMNRLLEKGWLESDSFLLSRQEQDWFSFYLNNAKFINGPAIRNIFEHGANTGYTEERMQMMYYQVLMLFITLLYKIDLDLRLGITVSEAMSSQ